MCNQEGSSTQHEILYNAIFRRKSVRKLQQDALPEDKLQLIKEYASNIQPLFTGADTKIVFFSAGEVSPRFSIAAPHYAAFYGPSGKQGMLSAGYQLQQLDLCLSAVGLGSCYLGMAKPQKEYAVQEGLSHLLMLAFGEPAVPCHRESTDEFSRKPLSAICAPGLPDELMEPVRLAPSAINAQPWYITHSGTSMQIWRAKPTGIKALLAGDISVADMGIALCHLQAAAEHAGLACVFNFEPEPAVLKGYELICSAEISKTEA